MLSKLFHPSEVMPADPLATTIIASLAAFSGIPIVAIIETSHPGSGDAWAISGALAASVFVILLESGRGAREQAAHFLASSSCGSFLPTIIFQIAFWRGWIPSDTVLPWGAWALLGFFFGLMGWKICHMVMHLGIRYLLGKISNIPNLPK